MTRLVDIHYRDNYSSFREEIIGKWGKWIYGPRRWPDEYEFGLFEFNEPISSYPLNKKRRFYFYKVKTET